MDIKLQQIASQSAGVYFLTYDNTSTPTLPANTQLRLFVINVPKGPVNSMVIVNAQDFAGFKSVFGELSRKDERNGNFSVRSCLTALENGPIAVLNVRTFDDALDTAGYASFPADTAGANGALATSPYRSLFDSDRLWKAEPSRLLDLAGAGDITAANIGNAPFTLFIRKSTTEEYEQAVGAYYAAQGKTPPAYVCPSDKVRDTFVDVFVFSGDFSDNAINQSNSAYGHLFGASGVKREYEQGGDVLDGLGMLATIRAAGFIKMYTGSLLPSLTASNGASLYIENIINADYGYTGLILKVRDADFDEAGDWEPTLKLDGTVDYASNGGKRPYAVDLVGHGRIALGADARYAFSTAEVTSHPVKLSYARTSFKGCLKTVDFDANSIAYVNTPEDSEMLKTTIFAATGSTAVSSFYCIGNDFPAGSLVVARTGNLCRINTSVSVGEVKMLHGLHTALIPLQASGEVFPKLLGVFVYPPLHADAGEPVEYSVLGVPLDGVGGSPIPMPTLTEAQVLALKAAYGTAYGLFLITAEEPIEAGDLSAMPAAAFTDESGNEYALSEAYAVKALPYYETPHLFYAPMRLDSYRVRAAQFCDGTAGRQKEVLDACLQPGILRGLKNIEEAYKFRYIVDVFKTYIETNIKYQLGVLAKECNVFAICNEPFVADFKASRNPFFRKTATSEFDISYIVSGGNRMLPASNSYGKPVVGDSFMAFFGPGIVAPTDGTDVIVPPAAAVSKAFLNKYTSKQPFTIVANEDGVVAASGYGALEYKFDDTDRAALEKVGYNPIIYVADKGNLIYGNNTAQIAAKTDLSKIHVRELVLHIQEQMKAILLDYVFKFNNFQNRLEILTRANSVMTTIQANGGVLYFQNVCDGTNNTEEIITADMGILDTTIVAAKGSEKMVHRTYLQKGSSITGFAIV